MDAEVRGALSNFLLRMRIVFFYRRERFHSILHVKLMNVMLGVYRIDILRREDFGV